MLNILCYAKMPIIKVRLFLNRSCAILSSFKIVVIFHNTSADFVLISADVLLKTTTILKELRIAQLQKQTDFKLKLLNRYASNYLQSQFYFWNLHVEHQVQDRWVG